MTKNIYMNNRIKIRLYPIKNLENRVTIRLVFKIGSMNEEIAGLAHFVEHMQLSFDRMGLLKKHNRFTICGKTHLEYTMYEFNCCGDLESIGITFDIIKNIIEGKYLVSDFMEVIRKDILEELHKKNFRSQGVEDFVILTNKKDLPIGNEEAICKITFKDIWNFFYEKYCKVPVYICVVGNYVAKDTRDLVQRKLGYEKKDDAITKEYYHNNIINIIRRKEKISIYIPLNPKILTNLEGRVDMDLFAMLIEYYLEDFFDSTLKKQIAIQNTIIRYAMNYQYLKFDMNNIEDVSIENIWNLFLEFVAMQFNPTVIKEIINQYKNITENCLVDNEDVVEELTNYFVYGNAPFERGKYVEILVKVEYDNLKKIFFEVLSGNIKKINIDS